MSADLAQAAVPTAATARRRILVLGASGFIGRRVVHCLSRTAWALPVAASRHATASAGESPREPPNQSISEGSKAVETLDLDVTNAAALRAALVGCNGIVNCIAGSAQSIIATSRTLIEAASACAIPPRLVHLSSLAAYGSAHGLIDESAPLRGDLDAYSAAKAESERIVSSYSNLVVLRPGIVYGPGSAWWSDRIARLLVHGRLGDLGARGAGHCNLVYVDDVAQAALQALQLADAARGVFNLSWPEALTWNEYFAAYALALQVKPLRRISPLRLQFETRLLAPPLKVLERLLAAPRLARWNPLPPLRPWLPELCSRDTRLEVSRATHGLQMRWTPLATGLKTTADWFLAGGRTR